MNELVITIISLVIGVAATLIIGRYYYRQADSKAITPFLYFSTDLLQGIAPEVRSRLHVDFGGVPVDDLQELQLLIANTGHRAIRDVIDPLTLNLPETCSVLDASVLHVAPAGRTVTVASTERVVRFEFPVLNRREFFLARILLRGKVTPRELSFSIVADDLPPMLQLAQLSPDMVAHPPEKRKFSWGTLLASVLFGLVGMCLATVVYQTWSGMPRVGTGLWSFVPRWSWAAAAAGGAAVPTLLFLVVSVMLLFGAFSDFSLSARRKFVLPSTLPYRFRVLFEGGEEFFRGPSEDQKGPNHALQPSAQTESPRRG